MLLPVRPEEFEDEGLELIVEADAVEHVVQQSIKRETGARGLASILTQVIEDAAFEHFGTDPRGAVAIMLVDGLLRVEHRS